MAKRDLIYGFLHHICIYSSSNIIMILLGYILMINIMMPYLFEGKCILIVLFKRGNIFKSIRLHYSKRMQMLIYTSIIGHLVFYTLIIINLL